MSKTNSNPATSPSVRSVGTLTGIDIGKHVAKLVVVRRQSQEMVVTRASSFYIPPGVQEAPAELANLLSEWLHEYSDPNCRNYVAALPSSMVDYETMALPSNESVDLCDFAEQAISELLGNDRGLASYDYWTSNGTSVPESLNLAWTSSEFASKLAIGLARNGWRCIAIETPAQTLARVSSLNQSSHTRSIVVDIGAGELSVAFTENSNSEYFRNRIRISTESATSTLAGVFGTSASAAENLLTHWGLGAGDVSQQTELEKLIAQHLTKWLQQLVFEIRRTLNYLKHRYGGDSDCELLLCGGGANIRGLPELLATELNTAVRFAEPSTAYSWESAERYSPLYAQALSLATYGVAK